MKSKRSKHIKHVLIFLAHISILIFIIISKLLDIQNPYVNLIGWGIWCIGIAILDIRMIINNLDNDYQYTNDEYQRRRQVARLEQEEEQKRQAIQANPYACPKCGGESFTPVRRNWSIWNGHRTNKIDMVCNKCGYVKKG